MKTIAIRILCIALSLVAVAAAQDVIPLYPGVAPGSAPETYPEKQYFSKAWNTDVVSNVTRPTLTVVQTLTGDEKRHRDCHLPGRWVHGPVHFQRRHRRR